MSGKLKNNCNIWDIAPIPGQGDESAEAVYQSVGKALSQWEEFESQFSLIFTALIGAQYTYPVSRAYGSILTFRGRSEMIEAAAEVLWVTSVKINRDELKSEMNSLLNHAGKLSARRNEIAHGIVSKYTDAYIYDPKPGWVLGPTIYATNKTTPSYRGIDAPKYIYSSSEIYAYGKHFEDLAPRAREISRKINGIKTRTGGD